MNDFCYNENMETKENQVIDNQIIEKQDEEPIEQVVTENKNRYRIDKLLGRKDLKYRGIFSGRAMKIVGFVLLFFAQIYLCIKLVGKFSDLSAFTTNLADVLDILSSFSLPMFLAANFCVIMTRKSQIKKTLIIYSVIAVSIWLLVVFVFYRYVMGIGKSLYPDDPNEAYSFADGLAKSLFGKVINYNVFVDLALFSLFYLFLFYTPKKMTKKKSIIAFRCLSLIPIIVAIIATALYGFYNFGIINLPVAVLSILPCRSITVYVIFFGIALIIKLRQYLFIKWGGTQEEYEVYANTNRSSLEISIVSAIIVIIVSLIDFIWLFVNPMAILFGVGVNFYLAFVAPLILLLSYTRKTKSSVWDIIMVVIFIFAVIILYLETGLYLVKYFMK